MTAALAAVAPIPMRGQQGTSQDSAMQPANDSGAKKQLGLKLESQKRQADILVIDHAERPTAD